MSSKSMSGKEVSEALLAHGFSVLDLYPERVYDDSHEKRYDQMGQARTGWSMWGRWDRDRGVSIWGGTFWFLVCNANTQLALQLQQEHIQVVRSNKVVRGLLTKSNGTPAIDLGHTNIVLK